MNARHKEREFILEWLQLYRELPMLWNVNCTDYHHRDKKKKAYDKLLNKYREMFPDSTKDDIKRKINTLRTNYRKEYKKYMQAMETDATDNIQKVWYFDAMSFLQNLETDDSQSIHIEREDLEREEERDFYFLPEQDSEYDSRSTGEREIIRRESSRVNINKQERDFASSPKSPMSRTIKRENNPLNQSSKLIYTEPGPTYTNNIELNEYHNWALACAADLQKMDPVQQIYAKKAIAEIIMEGRLGLLHRSSVKINMPLI